MLEMTRRLAKERGKVYRPIYEPLSTTLIVLELALVTCEALGAIHDEMKRWDWPWSS